MVKYEDELDLLAIVDVSHIEDEGQASVRLHNNKSGALLKKIALQEPWDVVSITQHPFTFAPSEQYLQLPFFLTDLQS